MLRKILEYSCSVFWAQNSSRASRPDLPEKGQTFTDELQQGGQGQILCAKFDLQLAWIWLASLAHWPTDGREATISKKFVTLSWKPLSVAQKRLRICHWISGSPGPQWVLMSFLMSQRCEICEKMYCMLQQQASIVWCNLVWPFDALTKQLRDVFCLENKHFPHHVASLIWEARGGFSHEVTDASCPYLEITGTSWPFLVQLLSWVGRTTILTGDFRPISGGACIGTRVSSCGKKLSALGHVGRTPMAAARLCSRDGECLSVAKSHQVRNVGANLRRKETLSCNATQRPLQEQLRMLQCSY